MLNSIAKSFFDLIKQGDIDKILSEREKLGIDLSTLRDETYQHNALFYVGQIKDTANAIRLTRIFIEDMGVSPNSVDLLKQTPLYYAAREGNN